MSFMEIAAVIATKSKDPSTKVGAVIVDSEKRIISTGYNGFVSGNDETFMTFERPMKYYLTIHAEMNALLFAKQDLSDKILYVTHSPCVECLKNILQARIRTIYYDKLYVGKTLTDGNEFEAITRLIVSTKAKVININSGNDYVADLAISDPDVSKRTAGASTNSTKHVTFAENPYIHKDLNTELNDELDKIADELGL